jgi:Domain of unknown function (DUF5668)
MERRTVGIILIVVGLLFALGTTDVIHFSWGTLWPIFLLIPSLVFHSVFFMSRTRSNAGLLVPGGILLVLSLLFFWCNFFGWDWMGSLWPMFMLAPALGLFELYLFGGGNPGLLIPVVILTVTALAFLGFNVLTGIFGSAIGVILVLVGVYIVFFSKKKKDRFF